MLEMHWEQCCTQIIARAQFTHEGVVCSCVYKHIAMVIVVLFCFFGALVIYSTHKHQELVNCISFSWRGCKGLVPSFLVCRGQWPHAEYPPPDSSGVLGLVTTEHPPPDFCCVGVRDHKVHSRGVVSDHRLPST